MTAAEINPSFFFFLLSFSFFSVVPFLARMNGWIDSLIHWFALIVLIASVTLSCGTGRFPVPARVGLLRPRHVVRQVLALRRRRGRAQGLRQRTRLRWHRPPQPARELRLPLQRRVRRTYWNRYGTLNPSGGTNQWRTFFFVWLLKQSRPSAPPTASVWTASSPMKTNATSSGAAGTEKPAATSAPPVWPTTTSPACASGPIRSTAAPLKVPLHLTFHDSDKQSLVQVPTQKNNQRETNSLLEEEGKKNKWGGRWSC